MIQIAIVDASVAVQWLIPEATTPLALRILREVEILAVPDLLYSEVGNAVWKRVQRGEISAQQGNLLLEELLTLPLIVYPTAELVLLAFQLATTFNLTVYDALYVALADSLNAPLITADNRLLTQAQAFTDPQVVAVSNITSII